MTERSLNIEEEQEVSISMRGGSFRIRFYPFRNLMYMDLTSRDEPIFSGKRVMANQWILPSYIAEETGNMRFETYASDSDDYVWWEGFNTKFRLVSYTPEEIAEMESTTEEE